jgi:hypothetical protein
VVVSTQKKQKSRGNKKKPIAEIKIVINGFSYTQKQLIKKLIEMESPKWLTTEIYNNTLKHWDKNREKMRQFSYFVKKLESALNLHESEITFHRKNDDTYHILNGVSPSTFYERFAKEDIISTPETGQDPKIVNKANTIAAQEHAGTHWQGQWKNPLTLNLVLYSNGRVVISIVDGEHRIWGIVGFLLGIVSLGHPKNEILYFESEKMISKIEVNGLTLPEIVKRANNNLRNADETISEYEVIERFDRYKVPVVVLPMYDKVECSSHFYDLNAKSSDKKIPQLMHSFSYPANDVIKTFSSIKNHSFGGSKDELHDFYENRFTPDEKSKLKTFMISHMILQFLNEKKFVNSSDSKIRDKFLSLKGYYGIFTEALLNSLIETLTFLESLYSQIKLAKSPSLQKIQQLMMIRMVIADNNIRIYNKKKFITQFESFVENNILKDDGSRSVFGANMYYGGKNNAEMAFETIRKYFLGNGDLHTFKNEEELKLIGLKPIGSTLPRTFSDKIIIESNRKYNNQNIEGSTFKKKPVGGHRISHHELENLSDSERDVAAKEEGGFTDDKFNHEENCRPMCDYHNNRMGILRLSRYLEIMHENTDFINQEIQNYRQELIDRDLK